MEDKTNVAQQVLALLNLLNQQAQPVFFSDFEKKYGKNTQPEWTDFLTHNEDLLHLTREKRAKVQLPGIPAVPLEPEKGDAKYFALHNKSQQAHQATLLTEAHDRMEMQMLLITVHGVIPEDLQVSGKRVRDIIREVIECNRCSIAHLRSKSYDLTRRVLGLHNGQQTTIVDMDQETVDEMANAYKSIMAKKAAAKKATDRVGQAANH
jgi:hypothetical protein